MKLSVPDHAPSASIRLSKVDSKILVTLEPFPLTQTTKSFGLDQMDEATILWQDWILRQEIPDKENFRSSLKRKITKPR